MNRENSHQEIKDTSNIIEEITGQKPNYFGPVGGNYNQSVINISKNNGLQTILWSWDQDPKDWSGKNYPAIIRHVVHNLSPGDIILFHDSGGDRTKTIKALPYIFEHLKENGYKSITVSEMIKLNTKHDFE
ncbi:polysaccharide deacetylase family protein [Roseburia sp. 1XD42-34]|nr:polysaccharide deacetylase family protein [Roseburia sp. 1XD42-34]RKI74474.1 polysaccharide deacetylase family protein [Clostridium sp. 1xD42-85]